MPISDEELTRIERSQRSLSESISALCREVVELRHFNTLKRYQVWRRSEDGRTMYEAGLTPKVIGEALDWAIEKLEGL